jgi:hypothetical protein
VNWGITQKWVMTVTKNTISCGQMYASRCIHRLTEDLDRITNIRPSDCEIQKASNKTTI